MSQCIVPNWNLRHQRQEEQVEGEERNRSLHVQSDQNLMSYVVPMCNDEVTELTWENGQLSLHGLGGINLPKQTWSKPEDCTLESVVHQATTFNHHNNFTQPQPTSSAVKWEHNSTSIEYNRDENLSSMAAGKWRENSSLVQTGIDRNHDEVKISSYCTDKWRENMQVERMKVNVNSTSNPTSGGGNWRESLSSMAASTGGKLGGKRVRCDQESHRKNNFHVEETSACGSASATFCRDTDTTMMTWPSFDSPRILKSARTADDDSLYHDCSENQDGERMANGESFRSQSSARRSRAAAVHNLSERRRRDRINQKMKTLQELVPNASKTDKASMLDEVIEYLKQLQAQVHMMSSARNMSQMVVPLGIQQQLQMSLLARMGMGMGMGKGMGMLDVNNLARHVPHSFPHLMHTAAPLGGSAPSFVSPPFTMPPVVPPPTPLKADVDAATINTSIPNLNEAYNTFLAQQSMNMDFLSKLSAFYRQQGSQLPPKKPVCQPVTPD